MLSQIAGSKDKEKEWNRILQVAHQACQSNDSSLQSNGFYLLYRLILVLRDVRPRNKLPWIAFHHFSFFFSSFPPLAENEGIWDESYSRYRSWIEQLKQ